MKPVNPNATLEAYNLLQYLNKVSGKQIITGQHTLTITMDEIAEIQKLTRETPALQGFELLSYSPNIYLDTADQACIKEVEENRHTIELALAFGKSGGIVTFTWHWFSPLYGKNKSFYTENTTFNPNLVLEQDTPERKAFFHDLDIMVNLLYPFHEAKIPILWRPFHESDGTWFWWGSKGPETAKQLYRLEYNYFVNKYHLNNLLWVWNSLLPAGYPGDDVVDILSCDIYEPIGTCTDYAKQYNILRTLTKTLKPVALAEVGILPDIKLLEKSHIPWCYYMSWSEDFVLSERFNTHKNLQTLYASNYTIKKNQLPNFH